MAHSRPGYNEETAVLVNLGVGLTVVASEECGAKSDSATDEGGVTSNADALKTSKIKSVGTGTVEKGHVDHKTIACLKGGYLL